MTEYCPPKLRASMLLYKLTALSIIAHFMISVIHADTVHIHIKENNCRLWKIITILMRHQGKWIHFSFFCYVYQHDKQQQVVEAVFIINVLFVQHLNELILSVMQELFATKREMVLALTEEEKVWGLWSAPLIWKYMKIKKYADYWSEWPWQSSNTKDFFWIDFILKLSFPCVFSVDRAPLWSNDAGFACFSLLSSNIIFIFIKYSSWFFR